MATKDASTFAQLGMAAMLPGMVHMVELMQAELDRMRTQLKALQSGDAPKIGRPLTQNGKPKKSFWDKLSAEERSAEMKRRYAAAKAAGKPRRTSTGRPAPGTENMTPEERRRYLDRVRHQLNRAKKAKQVARTPNRIAKLARKGMRNYWAKMTPEQRSAEMLRRRAVAANGAAV